MIQEDLSKQPDDEPVPELREIAREEWQMIEEDLAKQTQDEAAPEPIIRIPTRINDKNETYIMNVGGWGAAQLLKHGWVQGQELGKYNKGNIVPVELINMDLRHNRPLTQLPRPAPSSSP